VEDLAERVRALSWYHTIELPGGVVTPGAFDTRPALARVPLDADLSGRRCLDVGTWDGFWAFAMERRGAAEVVAIDVDDAARWDWPPRARLAARDGELSSARRGAAAFALAREALGSRVERLDRSVYELDPERVGAFDVVFLGSLLLHLRDPVAALDALRRVCAGALVCSEAVELVPSLLRPRTPTARLDGLDRPWWWQPNVAAFHRMLAGAGWRVTHRSRPYFVPVGAEHRRPPGVDALRDLRTATGRERLIVRALGVPHVAARAVPIGS